VATGLEGVDDELRETLEWAFAGTAKHFRPLTLFGCHRAVHVTPVPSQAVELAFVVELMHNMSLIVDDVLDGSDERRGVATIHRKFGRLPALMASGYLVADAFDAVADDPFAVRHLSELLRRLGSAECLQWRLRRQPLGVETGGGSQARTPGRCSRSAPSSAHVRNGCARSGVSSACSTTAATTSAISAASKRWVVAATRTSATGF
jgi:hypothetical protein